jgi:hypothetical protein
MDKVHRAIKDFEAARHLELWTYGHILEASEPYELLANMIDVSSGGRFKPECFPPRSSGRLLSPGEKIKQLEEAAVRISMPTVVIPLKEIWDRELRNAIFHADYVLHGSSIRIVRPSYRTYSGEEFMALLNKAFAYHDALAKLYKTNMASYREPKVIPVHPEFSPDPAERAIVIVRDNYGFIGMKDAWDHEELRAGKIPFRIGTFFPDELRMHSEDPTLAILPHTTQTGVEAPARRWDLFGILEALFARLYALWSRLHKKKAA